MRGKTLGKALLIITGLMLVGLFLFFDLDRFFTFEYLQGSRQSLLDLYRENPAAVVGGYMLTYIVLTTLSLPVAVVMTLIGGALFGVVIGTLAVAVAATTGVTLACAISRYILQDWVQSTFGDKLTAINRSIEREGGYYLFFVRLVPIFPLFVINLVMGVTKMPLFTYFWVSLLGMLPGTILFVNAGHQLGQIRDPSDIFSPALVLSFALLGLFPFVAKKGVERLRTRYIGGRRGK